MLKELYIENLAVIEKAVINFDGSFNVFTGETGAGKSILIGGINAVLGERVSKDLVRAGAEKALVSALLEADGQEILLTREISATGTSTARINGQTATAAQLKEAASKLIDIHGQHQTRLITSRETQLALTDAFGKVDKSQYQSAFREFSLVSKQLKQLEAANSLKADKIEILSGKIADVKPYKLKVGEEAQVAAELARLRNIQNISDELNKAYGTLSSTDENLGAVDLLNICKVALGEVSQYVGECNELKARICELVIETADIKNELGSLIGKNADASRLPALEERMSDFLRLRRKYSLDADELAVAYESWLEELDALQDSDNRLEQLAAQKKALGERVRVLGGELSEARKLAAARLSQRIQEELAYLDMPETQLIFEITSDKVTINGMDSVELLICANKGETPKPLAKIASGGELSRIMLAIKSVQTTADEVPVVIFDEIDAGISGRAAQKVGAKLAQLSRTRQVLCVTHLAQIAAMADNHLLIEKRVQDSRTYTLVTRLNQEQRKAELARIISGLAEDELSLATAGRLLGEMPT